MRLGLRSPTASEWPGAAQAHLLRGDASDGNLQGIEGLYHLSIDIVEGLPKGIGRLLLVVGWGIVIEAVDGNLPGPIRLLTQDRQELACAGDSTAAFLRS